ncbi:MAG: hypothetical protein ABSA22_11570, partial [Acidimicrobiales bacterium]
LVLAVPPGVLASDGGTRTRIGALTTPYGTWSVQLGRLQEILGHSERTKEVANLHDLILGEVARAS